MNESTELLRTSGGVRAPNPRTVAVLIFCFESPLFFYYDAGDAGPLTTIVAETIVMAANFWLLRWMEVIIFGIF